MTLSRLSPFLVALACTVGSSAGTATAQDICRHSDLQRRGAIPFFAFPLANPVTGEAYLANQEVDVGNGKTMRAAELFAQVNELERNLNEWGYSLRQGGTYTLEELLVCVSLLDAQNDLIAKTLSDSTAWWDLGERLERLEDSWNAYVEKIPSWDRLRAQADDERVKVFLPQPPAFFSPQTEFRRLEPKRIEKERSWSFEVGEKSKFYGAGELSLRMEAGKTRANASANGALRAGFLGVWSGEVLGATAKGSANEGSVARFETDFRVLGKTVFKPHWEQAGINLHDEWKQTVDHSVSWRFSIGPVPCRARVGFNGAIGVKYGVQVIPIEVGVHVTPFAGTKAYAQVGVDIGIAGAGVGGDLTLIQEAFKLTGSAGFSFADEERLVVELTGSHELEALSGQLYAYAYLDLWLKRWEGRKVFWSWDGFRKKGEVFRFRTAWSPSGVILEGDATVDDLRELDRQRGEIAEVDRVNTQAERERVMARLDAESVARLHSVMNGVANDLSGDAMVRLEQEQVRLSASDRALRDAVAMYWAEARRFGLSN